MTTLLKGHSTLKSTPVYATSVMQCRYRLTLAPEGRYAVHLEQRFPNGASSEGFLYLGASLESANEVYARYAQPLRGRKEA